MQELVARIEALGRRYAEKPEPVLRVADLTLNLRWQRTASREAAHRTFGAVS